MGMGKSIGCIMVYKYGIIFLKTESTGTAQYIMKNIIIFINRLDFIILFFFLYFFNIADIYISFPSSLSYYRSLSSFFFFISKDKLDIYQSTRGTKVTYLGLSSHLVPNIRLETVYIRTKR